jgi:hypothetical protein
MNKEFEDFRNRWLSSEKEKELMNLSLEQTKHLQSGDYKSFMATFSATFSLLLLAEYHEWLNQ